LLLISIDTSLTQKFHASVSAFQGDNNEAGSVAATGIIADFSPRLWQQGNQAMQRSVRPCFLANTHIVHFKRHQDD
jgi:hypothetical protein